MTDSADERAERAAEWRKQYEAWCAEGEKIIRGLTKAEEPESPMDALVKFLKNKREQAKRMNEASRELEAGNSEGAYARGRLAVAEETLAWIETWADATGGE